MVCYWDNDDRFKPSTRTWMGRAPTVVPCGSLESRPKGRGQPRRSCGRRCFCGTLLSHRRPELAAMVGVRVQAGEPAPHLVTPTIIGPPRSHRGSGSRAGWGYSGGALLAAHTNSRRRQRRRQRRWRSGRRRRSWRKLRGIPARLSPPSCQPPLYPHRERMAGAAGTRAGNSMR